MLRVFLTLWLAAFAVQSTELLASVVPDDCVEDTRGSDGDPCQENCARCVCCARVPIFILHVELPAAAVLVKTVSLPRLERPTASFPPSIYHVPKTL